MDTTSAKAPKPPTELTAGPISLRCMRESDWDLEQALSRDPEVVRWTYYPEAMDEAAARDRVRASIEHAEAGRLQRYVIWNGDDRIGTCGVAHLDTDRPEIMYVLSPDTRGKGLATRAALALIEWAASAGYSAVRLETVEGNTASERVARRAGFAVVRSGQEEHRGSQATVHVWECTLPRSRRS